VIPLSLDSMLDTVDIELSGFCNANCRFCPREKMTREKTLMSPGCFETLLRELSEIHPDGPGQIYFCGLGEPLLNRNLCSFSDIANEVFPDSLVIVVSNGIALNRELCDAMLTSGIYAFSCSMQSIHREKYEAATGGGQYDAVMYWMRYLAEKRWETGLQVTVTYVRTTQTDEELSEYYAYWNSLGIKVGENRLHSRGGNLYREGRPQGRMVRRCSLFETRLFVAANGDVLACCQDLDGASRLGTIGAEPLSTILQRKKSRIAEGILYPMCAGCDDCNVIVSE
jgi:MoaA/NifB/PqqE/SkfB family radical SAM enzyme